MKKQTELEVFKHNQSVSSKLSEVKTPLQFLLYSLIVAKVDNNLEFLHIKEEDLLLKITHKEILEQLEIKRVQPTFKEEIKDLSLLQIEHIDKDNKEEFIFINVFSKIAYRNHILTIKLNKDVMDYFIDLKSNFLSYSFKTLVKFKSKYTMLLYDLIQKDYYLLNRKYYFEYDLSFLLDKLQVNAKSMRVYQNFKVKILEKAIKEINTHTNLNITYKAIKNVYTVVKIRFLRLPKNTNKIAREKEEDRLKNSFVRTPETERLKSKMLKVEKEYQNKLYRINRKNESLLDSIDGMYQKKDSQDKI